MYSYLIATPLVNPLNINITIQLKTCHSCDHHAKPFELLLVLKYFNLSNRHFKVNKQI